jgi:hypothetical protein
MILSYLTLLILVFNCLDTKIVQSKNSRITFARSFLTTTLTNQWKEQFSTRLNIFDEGKGGIVQVGSFTDGMISVSIRILINNIEQSSINLSDGGLQPFYIPYGSSDKIFTIEMLTTSIRKGIAFVQIKN